MSVRGADVQARFSGTQAVAERHRFDVERLHGYLRTRLSGLADSLEVREFKGGQSNPTYQLVLPDRKLVLRRKPPGKLLKSAHAVDREYRVMRALHGTGFPVPEPLLLCEDPEIIGTPFYVMECVEGRVCWDALLPERGREERAAIYDSMAEILARLHAADPAALGLADFGRPGNYFARQIGRWSKQYRLSQTETIPEMDRLMEWLPAHLPEDEPPVIVHGDYKLDNMIVHPSEPRVIAVLDWELSTLGHSFGDLSYQLSQRHTPGSAFEGVSDQRLAELGIPSEAEYVASYCARAGRPAPENFDYYIAYNIFRTAAILQGIVGRVRDGTAASAHAAELASVVRPLAERADAIARRIG